MAENLLDGPPNPKRAKLNSPGFSASDSTGEAAGRGRRGGGRGRVRAGPGSAGRRAAGPGRLRPELRSCGRPSAGQDDPCRLLAAEASPGRVGGARCCVAGKFGGGLRSRCVRKFGVGAVRRRAAFRYAALFRLSPG